MAFPKRRFPMRFQKLTWLVMLTFGLALAVAAPAGAQVDTADLSGGVLDPQGAAIPGARVTVKKLDTGATRSTESDANGQYSFVGLTPGNYELSVDAKGFLSSVNSGLVLTIGQSAVFSPVLQIETG